MKQIVPEYIFDDKQLNTIELLAKELGLLSQTVGVMFGRGIDTNKKISKFLNAGREYFTDPCLLRGMDGFVSRLEQAKRENERVAIFGDYDADGLCASAIMRGALREYGVECSVYIPERVEGYGLSKDAVERIADEYAPDLFITVDCGISCHGEVEYIKDLGMDAIVTDHHELPDILPDCITVNPKLTNDEYTVNLCGAGVALKCAYALIGGGADKYIDLAAVATVADSVPLLYENRDIVCEGLKMLSGKNARTSLTALLNGNKNTEVNSQSISYSIAPRLNAAGRMGRAALALELLLSEDILEIQALSDELNALNQERQARCEELYRRAKELLEQKGAYSGIIVLHSKEWSTGFTGIVAAKLAEEYLRPVILFSGGGEVVKGSSRSIDNINIYEAILSAAELTEGFGGHSQAAGVSVRVDKLAEFEQKLDEYLAEKYTPSDYVRVLTVAGFASDKMDKRFIRELGLLEPCGVGNRSPLFCCDAGAKTPRQLKADSPHLGLDTDVLEMVYFNGLPYFKQFCDGFVKKLVFQPSISYFNGREYYKGYIKSFLSDYTGSEREKYCILANNLRQLKNVAERHDIEYVDTAAVQELIDQRTHGYGRCYIVGDADSLNNYTGLDALDKDVYTVSDNNLADRVLISPDGADLNGFYEVISLDNPLNLGGITYGKKIIVNNRLSVYTRFVGCVFSRERLIEVYGFLKENSDRLKGGGGVRLYYNHKPPFLAEEFIAAVEIFCELNLMTFIGESALLNLKAKADLSASAIYTRLCQIKEQSV